MTFIQRAMHFVKSNEFSIATTIAVIALIGNLAQCHIAQMERDARLSDKESDKSYIKHVLNIIDGKTYCWSKKPDADEKLRIYQISGEWHLHFQRLDSAIYENGLEPDEKPVNVDWKIGNFQLDKQLENGIKYSELDNGIVSRFYISDENGLSLTTYSSCFGNSGQSACYPMTRYVCGK